MSVPARFHEASGRIPPCGQTRCAAEPGFVGSDVWDREEFHELLQDRRLMRLGPRFDAGRGLKEK